MGGGKAWVIRPNCQCLNDVVHLCKDVIAPEELEGIQRLARKFNGQTVTGELGAEYSAEDTVEGRKATTKEDCISTCFPSVEDATAFANAMRSAGTFRIRQFQIKATPVRSTPLRARSG